MNSRRGRPGCPGFDEDDRAVSVVIGATLVFTVIILSLVLIQVNYVPKWEEEAEFSHSNRVQAQLLQIRSDATRHVDNATLHAVTIPIELGDDRSSQLFSPIGLPGSIDFEASTTQTAFSMPEFLRQIENGVDLQGAGEDWTTIPGADNVTSVDQAFRMRIRVDAPGDAPASSSVKITVYDADNQFAGFLRVYKDDAPSQEGMIVQVRNADNTLLFDQGEWRHHLAMPETWWTDALDRANQFENVLAAASKPMRLQFEETGGMDGDYSITYRGEGPGGIIIGSSGVLEPDYSRSLGGGKLTYETSYLYYPNQEIVLEHGALVLVQDGEATMLTGPVATVGSSGGQTRVSLAVPQLIGRSGGFVSTTTAGVTLIGATSGSLIGTTPQLNMTFPTDYPDAWATWWQDTLEEAGLDEGLGDFNITTTANAARIEVHGTDPDVGDHDVYLSLRDGRVTLRIET